MYGNTGKMLRIDLSKKTFTIDDTTPYLKKYLGGRALNHIVIFRDIDVEKVQPFDPENEILFSSGPLGGTKFPSSGRCQATFIAPLPYSGWGDSNIGGAIGPALKFAGWDIVVILGKADKPSYLYIEDDNIDFRSADDFWGKGIDESTKMLQERHIGAEILLIGPAGENLVRFANIRTHLTNCFGRTGGGAVMGSKNLKALVIKASKSVNGVKIFDPDKLLEISRQVRKDLMDPNFGKVHSLTYKIMSKYGTPGFTRLIGQAGAMPIKNWNQCGIWSEDDEITERMIDTWGIKREACFGCPVHCHGVYRVEDPKFPSFSGGPEFETVAAFGHKCLEPRGKVILKLNALCNDLGLDTVETGNLFGNLMEWYEKGIIDEKFTDGISMRWGNGEGMIKLVTKIAKKEGCGEKLGEGPYRVAKGLSEEALKCVYHQKGMGGTGGETRAAIGSMLQVALSPRGSHHLSGLPTAEWVNIPEVAVYVTGLKEAGDSRSYHPEAKAKLVQFYENLFELSDSMGVCKFNFGHFGYWHDRPEDLEKMWNYITKGLYYATGIDYTKKELMEIGERAYQIERAVIVMRGIRREDDMPNWKCLNKECPGDHPVGPVPLPPIERDKYEKVLDKYYEIRGWNKEGIPTRKRLERLDLKEVAVELERRRLI